MGKRRKKNNSHLLILIGISTIFSTFGGITSSLVTSDLLSVLNPFDLRVWIIFYLSTVIIIIATYKIQEYIESQKQSEWSEISRKSFLHQVPAPSGDFVGRKKELNDLRNKLEREGVVISGVGGTGGIGKSALAYKLVEYLSPRYPEAQIYIDMKGTSTPVSVADAMAHVIRSWDINAPIPDNDAALKALYNSTLRDKKAILLFDNADEKWQVEPLIPPSNCLMLITSRNHFTLPGCHSTNLDQMKPGDAHKLIKKIAPKLSKSETKKLAEICGYIPLALRTAAEGLNEAPHISTSEFMKRMEDSKERLGLVKGAFDVSYGLMEEDMQRLWRLLGVFPGDFDNMAVAAVWEIGLEEAQGALSRLIKRSMVECDEKTHRSRLHDLARDFAKSKLSEEEIGAVSFRHAVYFAMLSNHANDMFKQGADSCLIGLGMYDLERHNIEAGWEWAKEHWDERDDVARLCIFYALGNVNVLDLRLHPRDFLDWMESARNSAKKLKDRRNEAAALGNLGAAYQALGEYRRAIEYHNQALIILKEIRDRQCEGQALGNLGLAYYSLGEYKRAIEYYKQHLEIAKEIGDRLGESIALGNLGNVYYSLGEYKRAVEFHAQRLEIAKGIGDRRGEGVSFGNLGIAYHSLGEYKRAIEYYKQHLEIAKEIGDRLGESNSLGNLGNAYYSLGEYKRATEFYEQRLEIAKEIGDRRGEGNALFNMSKTLQKLGRREEALAHAKDALKIFMQLGVPEAEQARRWIKELEG